MWEHLEVNQSCSVFGFLEKAGALVPKGELVIEFLTMFDELDNVRYRGTRPYRNYKFRPDSVGGPIAMKLFTWDKKTVESDIRYNFWRVQ